MENYSFPKPGTPAMAEDFKKYWDDNRQQFGVDMAAAFRGYKNRHALYHESSAVSHRQPVKTAPTGNPVRFAKGTAKYFDAVVAAMARGVDPVDAHRTLDALIDENTK